VRPDLIASALTSLQHTAPDLVVELLVAGEVCDAHTNSSPGLVVEDRSTDGAPLAAEVSSHGEDLHKQATRITKNNPP